MTSGSEFIKSNIGTIGAAVGGAAIGAGIGAVVVAGIHKKRTKKNKRKAKTKSHHSRRKLKFGSKAYRKKYLHKGRRKQKQPHTAGKRKDTSHKRIRYTKNNQPYIIKADGRARFISKKSVSRSKKLKGGRY